MDDFKLSPHFSFFELTRTDNSGLQQRNRVAALDAVCADGRRVVDNLRALAASIMEPLRVALGAPIDIHSGYRCPELNAATGGSSQRSQHMLGQAADWSPAGPDSRESVASAFKTAEAALVVARISFGQLILEESAGRYGRAVWIHVSLGYPYRELKRCGEVLTMRKAADMASPEWTMLRRLIMPPEIEGPGGY